MVHWWFRRFARSLPFRTIHDLALMIDREPPDKAVFLDVAVKVARRISHR